jgi:hypothetical protein
MLASQKPARGAVTHSGPQVPPTRPRGMKLNAESTRVTRALAELRRDGDGFPSLLSGGDAGRHTFACQLQHLGPPRHLVEQPLGRLRQVREVFVDDRISV